MLDNWPVLSLLIVIPLLGALLLLFIPKEQGRWIRWIGVGTAFLPLLFAGWLYASYNKVSGGFQFEESYGWIKLHLNKEFLMSLHSLYLSFDYHLAVDGLSLPLVFLTALVTAMSALASVYIKKRLKTYFILFLILQAGMFGVFMARDLLLFFLFFEITLVPMFFLIGIWGYMNREKAANRFLLYNGLGSVIMLFAFLILITTAGFSQIQDASGAIMINFSGSIDTIMANLFSNPESFANQIPTENENPFYLGVGLKWTLFIMLLIAFGIKLPIFPFHTWMLKVHAEAPPSIVMIHSGILLKMGAYGMIRFGILLFPEQAKEWATVLAILGLINILYGAILAYVQTDFKMVLAYSSISHMGIVLLGFAAFVGGSQIGLQGSVIQLVSHGLISALLFLLVGGIYERTKTTELNQLGGLAAKVPFMSGILLIGGLASLGLPGLSGFVGEFLAFLGLFGSMKIITIISALGIILAAVYVLRAILSITYGPLAALQAEVKDARLVEAIPMIILVAFILLLGVYPDVISGILEQTINGFDQLVQNAVLKSGG